VVFIRGGLRLRDFDVLRHNMLNNPVFTRFLALGYACGEATFRDYYENVQDPGPILDCLAIVEAVRETPAVHRESVVLFGGSGGGSIALELAGMTQLAAIVVGEPATIIFTGMLKVGDGQVIEETMAYPHKYYTLELQQHTQAKIERISCPILVLHSDIHVINKINNEIFVPELKVAGKAVECRLYPGNEHGFYYGLNTDLETVEAFVSDATRFIEQAISIQPQRFESEVHRAGESGYDCRHR
jgi:acetyl esterase/lipase